jgi:hypothetical protein
MVSITADLPHWIGDPSSLAARRVATIGTYRTPLSVVHRSDMWSAADGRRAHDIVSLTPPL